MNKKKYYLKPNVVIEPLIDKWYAWSHLIFPATAAMNIKYRHLKIMNSYVQAPQIHAAATRNPKMLGGPFMNYKGIRKDEVTQLIDEVKEKRICMIELADAIHELDDLLKQEGNGYSLEPLYEKVPEILKGYVELHYDLNGNPNFRFIEELLYKSKYYDPAAQSLSLWLTQNDERPFVLSTARLPEKETVDVDIPFSHPIIDELNEMRRKPGCPEHIAEVLQIKEEKMDLFRSFFTEEAPIEYDKYNGDKVRMRYFGHACILVETKDVSVIVDPVISYYGYQNEVDRFSYEDLPDVIDYVLITHNHQDHILFETLLSLRHKVKKIIIPKGTLGNLQDPNLKVMFKAIGFDNVLEIQEMETLTFGNCKITGLPFMGEHGDLNIQSKICFNVNIGGHSMLFMADSCNIEPRLYDKVAQYVDPIDVIFLGMECDGAPFSWVYGPLVNGEVNREIDNTRRLAGSNYSRGKELVNTFRPKELYVYAMGLEPWIEFISSVRYDEDSNPIIASNKLIDYCTSLGITAERLFGEKEILYHMKQVEKREKETSNH